MRDVLRRARTIEDRGHVHGETPAAPGVRWLHEGAADIRFGARMLAKHPLLSGAVVVTLAFAIGVNTAVFSLVDALLLRALPVRNPHELVFLRTVRPDGATRAEFPYATFEAWRDGTRSLAGIFAYDESRVSAAIDGEAEMLDGDFVSGTYFDVLGVRARMGRMLRPDDDRPGSPPVAVISDAFWARRFGRDPAVLGLSLRLGDASVSVVGVSPPEFFGRRVSGPAADVVLPMSIQSRLRLRDHAVFQVMGRLAPAATVAAARAELDALFQVSAAASPELTSGKARADAARAPERVELVSALHGDARLREQLAAQLHMLLAVAAIVLLIACVNVANLLLARGTARRREIAARFALGAGRGRVIRQLLAESLVLALTGAALGLLLARWSAGALLTILTEADPVTFSARLDGRILAFSLAVSVLTALLCGVAPAIIATRLDLSAVLKGIETGVARRGARRPGVARSLIVPQVALSLALTVIAGMLVRTLHQLDAVETGFERDQVLTAWVFPVLAGYDHARELQLYDHVLRSVEALPGVRAASLSRYSLTRGFTLGIVTPRFFETMGIPLQQGRDFASSDDERAPGVAIISASAARRIFPLGDAVGQMLPADHELTRRIPADTSRARRGIQVVGIARDIRQRRRQRAWDEVVFIPHAQAPAEMLGQTKLLVRVNDVAAGMVSPLREAVRAVAADVPLVGLQTQAQELDGFLGDERSLAGLVSLFGVLALALAMLGLYGTTSYAVRRRTRELGIRLALGAQRSMILWMVLRETMPLVALGVGAGLVLALIGARLLSGILFGVGSVDLLSMSITVLLMTCLTMAATLVPARRAALVDPLRALRDD